MAAKKRRLMPDLDELQYKRGQTKSAIKGVEAAVRQLKEIDLMSTTSNVLSEDHSLLWLISLYGLRLVFMVVSCYNALPKALTENQMLHYLSRCCDCPVKEVKPLLSFIQANCPSLLEMLRPSDLPVVLAPPVCACINCGRRLVSNHCTKVKYYTEGGVSYADKVTLRCVDCKLFYNPTQYGNKSDLGFRYYPEVGRIVEATDSVCATRSLGEFQCSLA